jgi:hypothetical protein
MTLRWKQERNSACWTAEPTPSSFYRIAEVYYNISDPPQFTIWHLGRRHRRKWGRNLEPASTLAEAKQRAQADHDAGEAATNP